MSTNRKEFLQKLGILAASGSLLSSPLSAHAARKEGREKSPFATAPYLQNLTDQEVTLCIITGVESLVWVELSDENENSRKVFNKKDGFIDVGKGLVKFKIEGLKANTKYTYRLIIKEIDSFEPYKLEYGETYHTDNYTFQTRNPQADSMSCVVFNDIHDRPNSFKDLLQWNKKPFDFAFLNGDMFDYQTDEQQLIDHLIEPCTALFASETPFILSRGNHETRGKYARQIKDYFAYPKDKYYFTFQEGPVFFIVLDTGEDKPDDAPVYADIVDFDAYREEQKEWLENQVFNSDAYKNAKYKVVLMHIPTYHSGDWHGTLHCRKLFSPLFEKHAIDIVIAGHTHRYGVHPPEEEHSYPIIIGGGPQEGRRTLIQLEADPNKLSVNMLDDSGKKVGDYQIQSKT